MGIDQIQRKMKMKQIVLKYVVAFVTVIAAILAFIMTLGALAIFGMQVSSWPVLGFMAIILYHIVPRSSGTLSMSFSLIMANTYLGTMFLSRFCYQPLYYLLMISLAVSGVLVLLKDKPWWMWIVIAIVFIGNGVGLLYNNDIIGPTEFMISDMPFDFPAQWYHCYRFFWAGVLLNLIAWSAGIISVIILFVYYLFMKYRLSLKRLFENEL